MKTILKIALSLIAPYLTWSYVTWNYNPQNWHIGERLLSLVFCFFILLFMFLKEIKNWIDISNLYDDDDELY